MPDPSDYRGLTNAVLARPADDAPRFAFADCVRDLGYGELADFVEWQLAHPEMTAARRGDRVEFLAQDGKGWHGFMPDKLTSWFRDHSAEVVKGRDQYAHVWRRGFVDEMRGLTSTDWLDRHHGLRQIFPLRRVLLLSRLGWRGTGGAGRPAVLVGAERNVVAAGAWNREGRREHLCDRALVPSAADLGMTDEEARASGDFLGCILAREWPGVEVVMPPERTRPQGYRLPEGFRSSITFSGRPSSEAWEIGRLDG